MDEATEAHRDRLVTAIIAAVHDASLVEIDGETRAMLNVTTTCDAMVIAMAVLVEPAPGCRTTKGVRELSDMVARDLRSRVRHFRAIYERTGKRALPAEVVYPS